MLGTHYSSLSDILLEEAQTALKQQNDVKSGKMFDFNLKIAICSMLIYFTSAELNSIKTSLDTQKYNPPISNQFDFTASTLGIGAITVTNDGYIVLMRRASWTGEGAGKIDRPGGHPEPDEALKV